MSIRDSGGFAIMRRPDLDNSGVSVDRAIREEEGEQ